MTITTDRPVGDLVDPNRARPRGFLAALEGRPALGHIGPNWYASVMGTGIVANAAATLPVQTPVLHGVAVSVWLLATGLLVLVTAATITHWRRHPATARSHLDHPVMSHFYGAPAMALLTVGAGAVLLGRPILGAAAVPVDAVLWSAGTLLGLWTAVTVSVRAFTSHRNEPDAAFGGWLMPVVPPMVSAATGALLIPHLPAGEAQTTMLFGCYALFGMSLFAGMIIITLLWNRLVQHKIGPAPMVPTLWIALGVLGQSVTAAHNLGQQAANILPAPYGPVFDAVGLAFGLPVWGFALLWLGIAATITWRVARDTHTGLPFTLTWWSFTFPLGTVVTGTSGLAATTGLWLFAIVAVILYAGLVVAWVTVTVRTARGAWRGDLLLSPASAGQQGQLLRNRAIADRSQCPEPRSGPGPGPRW
ncbi:MAG TPA: TDT family transporter [Microlunatus sp.]